MNESLLCSDNRAVIFFFGKMYMFDLFDFPFFFFERGKQMSFWLSLNNLGNLSSENNSDSYTTIIINRKNGDL